MGALVTSIRTSWKVIIYYIKGDLLNLNRAALYFGLRPQSNIFNGWHFSVRASIVALKHQRPNAEKIFKAMNFFPSFHDLNNIYQYHNLFNESNKTINPFSCENSGVCHQNKKSKRMSKTRLFYCINHHNSNFFPDIELWWLATAKPVDVGKISIAL